MSFAALKLKPESGANRIKTADDAYSFLAHLRLSHQNKPHWQVARQALNNTGASDASEIQAWRAFREAVAAEGWLSDWVLAAHGVFEVHDRDHAGRSDARMPA
jgi:hypothetical protein